MTDELKCQWCGKPFGARMELDRARVIETKQNRTAEEAAELRRLDNDYCWSDMRGDLCEQHPDDLEAEVLKLRAALTEIKKGPLFVGNGMTAEQLAEIRARADAATAGPWQIIRETDEYGRALNSWQVDALYPSAELADAEFVAQSRADIPALLHEIESHKGALRYQTDVNIALREDAHRLRQELKVTNAEAERWHALAIERHHNLEEVAAANKRLVDEVKQLRARDETARYADRLGDFAKIKELQAENERLRAALTDLCSLAETFTLVAAYQGTPLTALSKSVEAAWRVLHG